MVESNVTAESEQRVYNWTFAAIFIANLGMMSAASLLYLYEDFVAAAGGSELELGWIVGFGMVGAIAFRLFQGLAIDVIGIRVIWVASLLVFIAGCLWHTRIESIDTWHVYLARLFVAAGIAGSLGCWLTFASLHAPTHRIAEVIGVVGISGFLGMATGPTIGDFLLSGYEKTTETTDRLFFTAAGLAIVSLVFALLATLKNVQKRSTGSHRPLQAIRNTKLGFLFIIGVTMGIAASIPSTFLRPFTKSLNIETVSMYFWIYNATAIACRLIFRRAAETIGLQMMTVIGLIGLAASLVLYLVVSNWWLLAIPAVAAGVSHAFLFPAVMTAGANRFAHEYRGLALSLMFAIFDVGLFIGAPLIGGVLATSEHLKLPAYPTTFLIFCLWVVCVLIIYMRRRGISLIGVRQESQTTGSAK